MDGLPIVNLTASTLLGLAVLMLLLGKIVPRTTLVDKIDEANRWRQAYESEREARKISDAQTSELLEMAKTTHALILAILHNSEQIRQMGETGVTTNE